MLLAKDVSDKSCMSTSLSYDSISISLALHQSSVLIVSGHLRWSYRDAVPASVNPLLKSCSKGKQVLSF